MVGTLISNSMKTLIKSINVFVSIVLVFGALGVAMLAFPVFGNKALIVRSGSMTPTIDVGSVIIVRDFGKVAKGDVIAFRSEKNKDTIITHRVTSIEKVGARTFYKTKGDANDSIDGWEVSPQNILGKTFIVVPEVGKLLTFARSELGLPLLIIVPSILVILLEILNIGSEIKKRKKKKELKELNTQLEINPKPSFFYPSSSAGIESRPNFTGLKVLLPFLIGAFVVQNTFAYFSDTEKSVGNFFAAAESFPTPSVTPSVTPTITPSVTPTVTPTLTPTPTPHQQCHNEVIVIGGGAGSYTEVIVVCEDETTVNQNNSTTVNTTVTQTSSTGGNSSSGNTNSTNDTATSNSPN